jgi:hypothetical protein
MKSNAFSNIEQTLIPNRFVNEFNGISGRMQLKNINIIYTFLKKGSGM